jgi:adenylyl-sulfate kinase
MILAEERRRRNGHSGAVIWLTGLPCAGKSTIALGAERVLFDDGYGVYVIDGDVLRRTLCADLGFSREDRSENVRRAAALAAILAEAGIIAICALISPFEADRVAARALCGGVFREVFIRCRPDVAEARDVKGHYRKARRGEIAEFTGVSSPYEEPSNPDLTIDTTAEAQGASVGRLVAYVRSLASAPEDEVTVSV